MSGAAEREARKMRRMELQAAWARRQEQAEQQDADEPSGCLHKSFGAEIIVTQMTGAEAIVEAYGAEVRISCTDCGKRFRFVGVEVGLSGTEPSMSADGLELRVPIVPEDGLPPPPFGYERAETLEALHEAAAELRESLRPFSQDPPCVRDSRP